MTGYVIGRGKDAYLIDPELPVERAHGAALDLTHLYCPSEKALVIRTPYHPYFRQEVKKLPDVRWCGKQKAWYVRGKHHSYYQLTDFVERTRATFHRNAADIESGLRVSRV